jgi:glyoxylase-like metal-dependent hydrolase (beta-lactamase superfamily II)
MEIDRIEVGPIETNCYIITNKDKTLVIDPGDDFEKIKEKLEGKNVIGCLVTHFHPDHIGALEELLSTYDIDVNGDYTSDFDYQVIEFPGHTFDSKAFYFKKDNTMFIGDFIFNGGIGRTDLGGNNKDMIDSLKKLKQYPDNTTLYPGHGKSTKLGQEKPNFAEYMKYL